MSGVAPDPPRASIGQFIEQCGVPRDHARGQQGCGRVKVAGAPLDRLLGRPHRVAHLEPGVPKWVQKTFHIGSSRASASGEYEEVDVGVGRQLPPAVAADRHNRDAVSQRRLQHEVQRTIEPHRALHRCLRSRIQVDRLREPDLR
jgi:hypothetical protein